MIPPEVLKAAKVGELGYTGALVYLLLVAE